MFKIMLHKNIITRKVYKLNFPEVGFIFLYKTKQQQQHNYYYLFLFWTEAKSKQARHIDKGALMHGLQGLKPRGLH